MGQGAKRFSTKYRLECEVEQDALLIKSMPPSSRLQALPKMGKEKEIPRCIRPRRTTSGTSGCSRRPETVTVSKAVICITLPLSGGQGPWDGEAES